MNLNRQNKRKIRRFSFNRLITGSSFNNLQLFKLNNNIAFGFFNEIRDIFGDSSELQKGLIIFFGTNPICGEGVGFGVPIVEYPNNTIFSTTAKFENKNGVFVKCFSMDSFSIKIWRNKKIKNRLYHIIQRKLANKYKKNPRIRLLLTYLIKLQTLFGIKSSYQRIYSKGVIKVRYFFEKKKIRIYVDSSGLTDKNYKRLLILNEQSSDFNLYKDKFGILRTIDIGAWEEINSEWASLTNETLKLTFCMKNITGTKLYRGRELIKPRLDWSGFCYSVPYSKKVFEYIINIEAN